jgi:hypothetical protein
MIPLAIGLTLISYATAQSISMVPMPSDMGSSSAAPSSSMSGPPAPTMPPSSAGSSLPPAYNQYSSSGNQYGAYSAPPAQYTAPPQTQDMPYSSFMAGGYSTMDCGYGYLKGYDGSCTSMKSWVRNAYFRCELFIRSKSSLVVYHWLLSVSADVSTIL